MTSCSHKPFAAKRTFRYMGGVESGSGWPAPCFLPDRTKYSLAYPQRAHWVSSPASAGIPVHFDSVRRVCQNAEWRGACVGLRFSSVNDSTLHNLCGRSEAIQSFDGLSRHRSRLLSAHARRLVGGRVVSQSAFCIFATLLRGFCVVPLLARRTDGCLRDKKSAILGVARVACGAGTPGDLLAIADAGKTAFWSFFSCPRFITYLASGVRLVSWSGACVGHGLGGSCCCRSACYILSADLATDRPKRLASRIRCRSSIGLGSNCSADDWLHRYEIHACPVLGSIFFCQQSWGSPQPPAMCSSGLSQRAPSWPRCSFYSRLECRNWGFGRRTATG